MNDAIQMLLTFHFGMVVGAFAPGARVLVDAGTPNAIEGTVLGLAIHDGSDDESPWMAVKLDGFSFDYGDGPGVEHRPTNQLTLIGGVS